MGAAVGALYRPLLDAQSEERWGKARQSERTEFLIGLDSLVANLQV